MLIARPVSSARSMGARLSLCSIFTTSGSSRSSPSARSARASSSLGGQSVTFEAGSRCGLIGPSAHRPRAGPVADALSQKRPFWGIHLSGLGALGRLRACRSGRRRERRAAGLLRPPEPECREKTPSDSAAPHTSPQRGVVRLSGYPTRPFLRRPARVGAGGANTRERRLKIPSLFQRLSRGAVHGNRDVRAVTQLLGYAADAPRRLRDDQGLAMAVRAGVAWRAAGGVSWAAAG